MSDPSTRQGKPSTAASGNRPRWYRSLYWRIALGLFAFLALMLAAEAALLLWVSDRMAGSMPANSPQRLAVLVASDVGAALARDPSLDLDAYLREEYDDVLQTFFVILRDGRVAANHADAPADARGRRPRRGGQRAGAGRAAAAAATATIRRRQTIRRAGTPAGAASPRSRVTGHRRRNGRSAASPCSAAARDSSVSSASSDRRWGWSRAACCWSAPR